VAADGGGGNESMLSVSKPILSYPELKHWDLLDRLLLRPGKVVAVLVL
jgi:hypothetical protein